MCRREAHSGCRRITAALTVDARGTFMGGGSSVPLRDAERIDKERARELADDAWSEDCFDRLCGADGRITADQLHTLAIALAPLKAKDPVFAAVLEASENRVYLENAANELSAGAAEKLVRDAFVEFSLTAGDDELAGAARRRQQQGERQHPLTHCVWDKGINGPGAGPFGMLRAKRSSSWRGGGSLGEGVSSRSLTAQASSGPTAVPVPGAYPELSDTCAGGGPQPTYDTCNESEQGFKACRFPTTVAEASFISPQNPQ